MRDEMHFGRRNVLEGIAGQLQKEGTRKQFLIILAIVFNYLILISLIAINYIEHVSLRYRIETLQTTVGIIDQRSQATREEQLRRSGMVYKKD